MPRITENELLLVSKSNQETLRGFARGVQLTTRSGRSIHELQVRVALDRLKLANLHLRQASAAARAKAPHHRATVSRAYYAMYHAARAVTYLAIGGDDHEGHSVLPMKLPADFPDCDEWKNRLKIARLERNRADYDPYPAGDVEFSDSAGELLQNARMLVKLSRAYLHSKT
ncbi:MULTISPECIES: HEPN domain-containing protein [Achromobacter]|uniref:HEPN domain-containing protein n=1 Tax=Achromobacter spanius TaxID=217203 RepID=A0ABY8GV14_9BURK|nr:MULTISPECIES: HEPN domain-containing protein [Achromobacter]WAI82281.1 HEPN domain-containing protein [Achromobacter spanius]WEX92369.1 HEPN domain-containing protein [Achromobacter sp. SS2-2022]WFP08480.1 HEPN domain-containing protein [Achromobacter spanius]